MHGGRVLARPLIREILREIEITVDEYNECQGNYYACSNVLQ